MRTATGIWIAWQHIPKPTRVTITGAVMDELTGNYASVLSNIV
jgi:hypothetical protein